MIKRFYLITVSLFLIFGGLRTRAQYELGIPSFAKAEDAKIAYWVIGEGEPLLLVHGFLGRATSWVKHIPTLSKNHQLILVELRDHGYSTNLKDTYNNFEAAADMVAVLDAIGIKSVDAAGFSAGALALLNMAVEHPERLKSIAVIGGMTHFSDKANKIFNNFHLDNIDRNTFINFSNQHEGDTLKMKRLLGYLQDFSEDKKPIFTTSQLKSINTPTLIISGDRDALISVEQAMDMYRSIPNSYLMIFPNTGHSYGPYSELGKNYLMSTILDFISKRWKCPAYCDN